MIFACLYMPPTRGASYVWLHVLMVPATKKRTGRKIIIIIWCGVGYWPTVVVFHDNNIIVYYYRVTPTLKSSLRVAAVENINIIASPVAAKYSCIRLKALQRIYISNCTHTIDDRSVEYFENIVVVCKILWQHYYSRVGLVLTSHNTFLNNCNGFSCSDAYIKVYISTSYLNVNLLSFKWFTKWGNPDLFYWPAHLLKYSKFCNFQGPYFQVLTRIFKISK